MRHHETLGVERFECSPIMWLHDASRAIRGSRPGPPRLSCACVATFSIHSFKPISCLDFMCFRVYLERSIERSEHRTPHPLVCSHCAGSRRPDNSPSAELWRKVSAATALCGSGL